MQEYTFHYFQDEFLMFTNDSNFLNYYTRQYSTFNYCDLAFCFNCILFNVLINVVANNLKSTGNPCTKTKHK